ncbi:hypothetical protein SFA33_24995 [Escherichia coli]|nr:hypothetical protein [Escherichia coli]MDW9183027.1 hypothetical protein [Escherichia coli]MDW9200305.1 hypothetical protein [Escherichia coli]MDW9215723.1 hypothetical protein [Escherichia coli]MDX1835770.1 hypothetical protein [Escherichia coli]
MPSVRTQCDALGDGKNPPNTKKNFGYLMWRKRNCVFL